MASLAYMIYEENAKVEDGTRRFQQSETQPSTGDRSHDLFSSFRQKSIVVNRTDSGRMRLAVGTTIAARPPTLRDLIQESGILQELEQDEDLRSMLEEEVDGFSAGWSSSDKASSVSVDNTLRDVMNEVLSMDNQRPIPCTCASGECIYHSNLTEDEFETISIPSRQSQASSFAEIPHYCTPQFEPQYLTPMRIASSHSIIEESSPPKVEASQPSRSMVQDSVPALGRPPMSLQATKNRRPGAINRQQFSPEEADDIVNSSHVPDHISRHAPQRHDSTQTYHTMVSELTLPYEMQSPFRALHLMKLDPRAPQFQMARQQDKQTRDVTVRTRNNNYALSQGDLEPPLRRPTPDGESPEPPMRKHSSASHQRGRKELPPCFEHELEVPSEDEEEECLLLDPIGRKGTIGGTAARQPSSEKGPQEPFNSPVRDDRKAFEMPSTPRQDSNPLLFPANLLSPTEEPSDDTSISYESIVGPFVSPSAVPRRYRPLPDTPKHDSNPLLFPQGIGYYPPSPTKIPKPPKRDPSPTNTQQEEGANRVVPILPLPLETDCTDCDAKTSSHSESPSSGQTSGQSTSGNEEATHGGVRVKLSPRVISFFVDGQERIHTGFYSGEIDKEDRSHGNGVFWFSSGDVYLGQFLRGDMHGVGVLAVQEGGSRQILRGFFYHNEFVGVDQPNK
jgi:hypothetical protein